MPISGELRAMNLFNVQGVPMSEVLKLVFIPDAVSAAGYIRDPELYEFLYEENVLPVRRYHWLMESLEERIKVYRLMVGFLIQGGEVKDNLPGEFVRNVDFSRPSRCLASCLGYYRELIEEYPHKSRGRIIFDDLADDKGHYEYLFPHTSFRDMSQILRGASWVAPENWGFP